MPGTMPGMRHLFRHHLPDRNAVLANRWLRPFAGTLLHPRLWHLSRRSVAGGVAVGLFCAMIPGPFQMPAGAVGALLFKVNLPSALLMTLVTNPLTIVPLHYLAFRIGQWVLGNGQSFVSPPGWADGDSLMQWVDQLVHWMIGLGEPLFLGLFLLATTLAMVGYFSVSTLWHWQVFRHRSRRKATRQR